MVQYLSCQIEVGEVSLGGVLVVVVHPTHHTFPYPQQMLNTLIICILQQDSNK